MVFATGRFMCIMSTSVMKKNVKHDQPGILLVCLLALAGLIFSGSLLPRAESYGEEEVSYTNLLFQSSDTALQHPSRGQRQLSHVPDKRLLLPPYFTLIDLEAKSEDDFNCTVTNTAPSFPICVYPTQQDIYISAALLSSGVWEPYMTRVYQVALKKHPAAAVIDIGANVGYYSLMAGTMGHTVIAVEPSLENVKRLKRGAQLSGLVDKIVLLKNALAKTHRNLTLSVNSVNQGGIQVLEEGDCREGETTRTIVLNDLLHVLTADTAIVKIDIEGYECRGMETSLKFFRAIKVPYIFMEWQQMYKRRHKGAPCPASVMRLQNVWVFWKRVLITHC
nr:hypothetical protein BaRGS_027728 [Batillaria attramentaria]